MLLVAASVIRAATPGDFESILRLNQEWEHATSPLTLESLAHLHEHATHHRVVEVDSRVAAFLLALGPNVPYDSPNYRWFDSGARDFLYIDRVVVSSQYQRAGLGDALYDDLTEFGRQSGISRLVCEIDIEPCNSASDAFHSRRGFAEVGTQWIQASKKLVSLRECILTA